MAAMRALLVLAILLVSLSAAAQGYPNKPIRLIVVTAAGGLMDVAARVLADSLDKSLGQRLVIENRSGSGGNIGAEAVAKSDPDGYTLGLVQIGNVAINPHIYTDMTFDPLVDLVPVAPVTSSAILVVANAKVPAGNLTELIALAKKEPGKLSYGSGGNGTAPHLAGEMFKAAAGVDILHVPYRGNAPMTVAVVAGEVNMVFDSLTGPLQHIRSGALRAIAMMGTNRNTALPDVPTMSEAGLPGFSYESWNGILAPAGTPEVAINRIHQEIVAALALLDVRERLTGLGYEPVSMTPKDFGAMIARDVTRFGDIIREAGIKAE